MSYETLNKTPVDDGDVIVKENTLGTDPHKILSTTPNGILNMFALPEISAPFLAIAAIVDPNFLENFYKAFPIENKELNSQIKSKKSKFLAPETYNELLGADFAGNVDGSPDFYNRGQKWENFYKGLNQCLADIQVMIDFFNTQIVEYFAIKSQGIDTKNITPDQWAEFFVTLSQEDETFKIIQLIESMQKHKVKIPDARKLEECFLFSLYSNSIGYFYALALVGSIGWGAGSYFLLNLYMGILASNPILFSLAAGFVFILIVTSLAMTLGSRPRKNEIEAYHNHAEHQLDNFQGYMERMLCAFIILDPALDILESPNPLTDGSQLTKNSFILCKQTNPASWQDTFTFYYNDNDGNLNQIKLNFVTQSFLFAKSNLVNGNNNVSPTDKEDFKKTLYLDCSVIKQKIEQRDQLAELLMSDQFKNTNSRAILNIQEQLRKYPQMTSDRLFQLIQTEIEKSIKIDCNINSFFKGLRRHPNMQLLYDKVNGEGNFKQNGKLDLLYNREHRDKLIDFINNNGPFVKTADQTLEESSNETGYQRVIVV